MFAAINAFLTSSVSSYSINKSLRFRSSASAYLNRTFAAGNQKTWTWSAWVKRGTLSANQTFFGQGTGVALSGYGFMRFDAGDTISIAASSNGAISSLDWTSTPVYRDPASWYHVVAVLDTTQGTGSDRFKLYVNGAIQSGTFATTPSSSADIQINRAAAHQIAVTNASSLSGYFDGELAEVNFVDGQALTAASFGATGANSQWLPIAYAGTYGTNGFYLPFTNTTSTSTLVADSSGNANNWTPNNISLTAGSTYDSLTDVPTLTSATVANYAVLNPLGASTPTIPATLSNANLTAAYNRAVNNSWVPATIAIPSAGKWYWEWVQTADTVAGLPWAFSGVIDVTCNRSTDTPSVSRMIIGTNGNKYSNTGGNVAYGSAGALNDIFGVAVDMGSGKIFFSKNGTWQASSDPVAGTNAAFTDLVSSGTTWVPAFFFGGDTTGTVHINFGQQPFTYTPPTDFLRLNTYNIAAGTVTTSGTFTGNLSTDGPMVYLNGTPTTMTINGNAVTFGTQADKLANGFKVRSSSASYNASGSNTYSASTVEAVFKYEDAQSNP